MNLLYIEKVIKEALKAKKKGEIPVGCIIVQNNKIISKAHNLKERKKNALYHAEILALKKAYKKVKDWRLNDCILITSLYPCPMCASAIIQSRIKTIYYITESTNKENKEITNKIFKIGCMNQRINIEKLNYEDKMIKNFFEEIREKI